MIWVIAHFEKAAWIDDWVFDFVGTEEQARTMLAELRENKPQVVYHLFVEAEAAGSGFQEVMG